MSSAAVVIGTLRVKSGIFNIIMDRAKRTSAFEHAQNAQIEFFLRMCKVSSGPLLSSYTFCSIQ